MSPRNAIYLDSNAGAPLHPRAAEALNEFLRPKDDLTVIPNPSSIHSHGRRAKRAIAEAREHIARSIGAGTDPEQILFTSSGSEANQLAIRSVFEPLLKAGRKPHWITTPVEHDSVLQMIDWLKQAGGEVSLLPVDENGRPQPQALRELWRPETALVSVLWVGNETGVISPLSEVSSEVRARGGALHVDAAQAWGKLPIDVGLLGANWVTFSGHKIGGLAGSGAVWIAKGTRVQPLLLGKQEKGRRAGTENLLGIVAMGAAASAIDPLTWTAQVRPFRDSLEDDIRNRILGTIVNGGTAPRVAGTSSLSFEGVEGDGLVMALDLAGFSVSSGSACSSGVLEPSHVLMAMGRTRKQAMAAVRVSLHTGLGAADLRDFAEGLQAVVERVRSSAAAYEARSGRTPDISRELKE